MEKIIRKYLDTLYMPYTINIEHIKHLNTKLKQINIKIRTKFKYKDLEISEFTLKHVFYYFPQKDKKIHVQYIKTVYGTDFYFNFKNYIKLINTENVPELIGYRNNNNSLDSIFLKPFPHAYSTTFQINYKQKKLINYEKYTSICLEVESIKREFNTKKEAETYIGNLTVSITDSLFYIDEDDMFGKISNISKEKVYDIKNELQRYFTDIIKNSDVFTKNKKLYENRNKYNL